MKRKLRILLVTREFPPYHEGGAGRRSGELVKATREYVDYTILTLGPKNEVIEYFNNVKIIVIKSYSYIKYNLSERGIPLFSNDMMVLYDIARLNDVARRLLEKEDYDAYEVVEPYYALKLNNKHIKNKVRKIVTLLHSRQQEFLYSIKEISHPSDLKFLLFLSVVGPILDKIGMKDTCRIIADSNFVKMEAQRLYGLDPDKIDVVPNPLPSMSNIKPRVDKGLDYGRRPVIAYFGRLVYRKNVSLLVKASNYLIKNGFNHILLIIGDGPSKHKLLKLGTGNHIVFTGRVPDSKLSRILDKVDIIVNPSFYEGGHPLAVLEAMSLGAVPVLSRIPTHYEIVRGTQFEKYLFEPNDFKELSEKIKLSINEVRNDEENMRRTAISIVKTRFSTEKIGKLLIDAYWKAIGEDICA